MAGYIRFGVWELCIAIQYIRQRFHWSIHRISADTTGNRNNIAYYVCRNTNCSGSSWMQISRSILGKGSHSAIGDSRVQDDYDVCVSKKVSFADHVDGCGLSEKIALTIINYVADRWC